MGKSSVLIVEDEDLQRRPLERQLKWSGFEVVSAKDVASARARASERSHPFDVVVLDMQLKDEITGAQLGRELLQHPAWRRRPPEFLINSAFSWNEYYGQALDLGVAAYLKKDRADVHDVVRHVQVLALRRALSLETPDVVERIRRIAVTSCDLGEAIRRFCTDFVCSELRESFKHAFLVLLTVDSITIGFSHKVDLPHESAVYSLLQALTFGETGRSSPFVLDIAKLRRRKEITPEGASILEVLSWCAFIPLAAERDVRLSVGILPASVEKDSRAEARQIGELLGQFFRPAVLEGLLKVLAAFTELEQRREEVARATAQFCLYVGQEQLASLDAAEDSGEFVSRGFYLEKLRSLAEDLTHSGALIGELVRQKRSNDEEGLSSVIREVLGMGNLVRRAWEKAGRMIREEDRKVFSMEGDCRVRGSGEYLLLALAQVLHWFVQRVTETPFGEAPSIAVRCEESEDGPRVVFTDRSRKLPVGLREQLFVPLATGVFRRSPDTDSDFRGPGVHLSLYLAKVLVELGNGGLLLDESERIEGAIGHKLVMRFPLVPALAA